MREDYARSLKRAHDALPGASRERNPAANIAGRSYRPELPLAGGLVFALVHRINNTLDKNGSTCRFRARLAIPYKLAGPCAAM